MLVPLASLELAVSLVSPLSLVSLQSLVSLLSEKYHTNYFREISLTKQGYLYHKNISPTNFIRFN